ncbi:MAG: RNA-binding domain-containing protein [Candidatus Bathyarchaeia archaeon]
MRAKNGFNVQLTAYVHATESQEKVVEAVKKCVPRDLLGRLRCNAQKVDGHFGNPITILRLEASGEGLPERLVRHIAEGLGTLDREHLSRSLERYVDEKGTLSLRVDKQRAYMGELKLGLADAILIKVKARPQPGISGFEAVKPLLEKAGFFS